MVRTINSLSRCTEGKDLHVVLLYYIIQQTKDMTSPVELIIGRKWGSFLKSHLEKLKPKYSTEDVRVALKKRKSLKICLLSSIQLSCRNCIIIHRCT